MMEKHQTISGLKKFNLADVHCRLDKDRVFILTAISQWYGSEESFVDYVKGPLHREVVAAATNRLPFHYALLTVLIPYSVSLDVLVALIGAGAPSEVILSELIGSGFGWVLCWQLVSAKLLWVLCDKLAAPRSSRVLDYLVSLLIFLAYFIFVFAGYVISDLLYSTSMWAGFAFAGFASLLVLVSYRLWVENARLGGCLRHTTQARVHLSLKIQLVDFPGVLRFHTCQICQGVNFWHRLQNSNLSQCIWVPI